MAEMYVYKGPHWYDLDDEFTGTNAYLLAHEKIDNNSALTSKQKTKAKNILTGKYNARWRPGDVVQVMEDGTMWDKKKNAWKFENHNPKLMFVKLDGINPKNARAKYMPSYIARSSYEETRKVTREQYIANPLVDFFTENPIIIREYLSAHYDKKIGQIIDIPMVELRGYFWQMKARRKIRLKIETAPLQKLTDMENMRVVLSSIAEEDKSK